MKRIALPLALTLLAGCSTVDRRWTDAKCTDNGLTKSECAVARMADERAQESGARWGNAGKGAVAGCLLTGPFCILGVGPLVGALVGGAQDVSYDEKGQTVEQ